MRTWGLRDTSGMSDGVKEDRKQTNDQYLWCYFRAFLTMHSIPPTSLLVGTSGSVDEVLGCSRLALRVLGGMD